jgi:predicted phosphoribosyltransferase
MFSNDHMFVDRTDAGKELGEYLRLKKIPDPVVFALPRGGVTVAKEVAERLGVSLDVIIARKIGSPDQPEYGIGALSEDEVPLFNPEIVRYFDLKGPEISAIVAEEKAELRRRISYYRQGRKLPSLKGKTAILVDDGLATGVTAAAAGEFLKKLHPEKSVLAVPIGPREISPMVKEQFDEIICLQRPEFLQAVGLWYEDFTQVQDDEVLETLGQFHLAPPPPDNNQGHRDG